jgi:transcriptional regulator with XRE-family HTH domain
VENKNIFAENLQYYMDEKGVTRREVSEALGVSYFTFTSWVNGKKYPRMDKVEILAEYFGIQKSDLIEEKLTEEKEKDNDTLADVIVRMRTDEAFRSLVERLYVLDSAKIEGVSRMLQAFD